MSEHKLERNKPKGVCPHCGKPRRWRFFEGYHGDTRYGICDRVNNCPSRGQIYYPDNKKSLPRFEIGDRDVAKKLELILEHKDIYKILQKTNTSFHKYCYSLGISVQHMINWNIGGRDNFTIFVFQNIEKQYLNYKTGLYDIKGNRNKDFGFFSLKATNKGYYKLCLFGEHLLSGKKIMMVEAEKTAVIASWFYPDYDWLSCGAANGLSDGNNGSNDKISVLKGKEVTWIADGDIAGRSNSSLNNLRKHDIKHNVLDLFPIRTDGYDLADRIKEDSNDLPKI